MKNPEQISRRNLIEIVKIRLSQLLSELEFVQQPYYARNRLDLNFHRKRLDASYDVISIRFDESRRSEFYAAINLIPPDGLRQPWGEIVAAKDATALTPCRRIMLLKKNRGILSYLLPKWFSHIWFGFKPTDNPGKNQLLAQQACEEFIACLTQAEKWWATQEMGPNLVKAEIFTK